MPTEHLNLVYSPFKFFKSRTKKGFKSHTDVHCIMYIVEIIPTMLT